MTKEEEAELMRTLGGRVKWARTQRDLSQAALGQLAKVSQGTIGNIESGTRRKPRELLAIARALRANPDWIENGRGDWSTDKAKGAVFNEPDEAEREMLYNWRRMMDEDRAELIPEIERRAERFQANMAKYMKDMVPSAPRQAGASAKAAIARAAVQPRQGQLPLEEGERKK